MNGIEFIMVYVPCPSNKVAEDLAHKAVERRLAACANILKAGNSFYWWEGKVQKDPETILILKTRLDLYDRVKEFIEQNHPYTVPAILALPIIKGNEKYLDWLRTETFQTDI